jgi:hypothetical protein
MWWIWVLGVVVVIGVIVVVMNRRGSTGASRDDDQPGHRDDRAPDPGIRGSSGGGGFGVDGGGV